MKVQIKKDLIYFTGFMAGGKSTIGLIVANTLGYAYTDIDKEIETRSGKKVTEIFAELGESYFRELETQVLSEISKLPRHVISLGGGTIINPKNLKIIKSNGLLLYLKSGSENIFKRLRYKTDRPVFMDKDRKWLRDSELKDKIKMLMETREPFYQQSDLTFLTDNKPVGVTVDEIIKRIKPLIEL
ncbi:MAG: shikimate kinase [Bacteroidota bacterium]|nr:shikimate kinase [Bacteroidota bacterium]